jgi:hypothetical protein
VKQKTSLYILQKHICIDKKIGFYGLLDMFYHLGRSKTSFEKKIFFTMENWFSKNPISGGL